MHQLLCTKRAVRGKVIYNKVMDRSWLNNNLGGTPTNARIPCPEYQVGREERRERKGERRREIYRLCLQSRGTSEVSLPRPAEMAVTSGRTRHLLNKTQTFECGFAGIFKRLLLQYSETLHNLQWLKYPSS